ncbi:MAG: hypothetical protein WAU39_17230 [Polyangiales bacterium]
MGEKRACWGAAFVGLSIVLCPFSVAVAQTEAPSGVDGTGDPTLVPTEDTLETTYGLAMGSGARAGATAISGLAYNNSNMAAISTYHVEAFSQIIPGSKGDGGTYWTIGSSVTDSTTAKRVALGTSFRGVFGGENRRYSGWDWRSAIGIQAIPQLGIGLGFRWAKIRADKDNDQRLGPSLERVTMDASITITPLPWLKIAGLGYNLIRTHSPLAPQMAGGSVSVTPLESFGLGGDVLVDLTTFDKTELIAGGGLSYIAGELVPLRIGYRRDSGRDLNQITAGIGINKGKIGFEGSLRQDLKGRNETYLLFTFRFVVQ